MGLLSFLSSVVMNSGTIELLVAKGSLYTLVILLLVCGMGRLWVCSCCVTLQVWFYCCLRCWLMICLMDGVVGLGVGFFL